MSEHVIEDLDRSLGTVTTPPLPAHVRHPQTQLQKELAAYPKMREEQRSTIEPRLLAANDMAFSQAINRVLVGFGLDRRRLTVAVEPDSPGPKSGAIVFTGSPFAWLRRLLRRRRR